MILAMNAIQKKFFVLQKKSSVICAKLHSSSLAKQFDRTEWLVSLAYGCFSFQRKAYS